MIKFILIIVAFSTSPQGVSLKPVATYDHFHECSTFARAENLAAGQRKDAERMVCVKVVI